jgi:hypothetical protein
MARAARGEGKMRPEPDRNEASITEDRMEELLQELTPVDLPPFYRTRLLARVREASREPSWAARVRAPRFAWSVATICVVALVLTVTQMKLRSPLRSPGAEDASVAVAYEPSVEPVMPADNSVVGVGDVDIVAAIYPPVENGIVRLYVDERDVTGLADISSDYVMYSPPEGLEEGEHIVTIEIRDASGRKLKDASWLFYTLNGRRPVAAERV